MQGQLPNFDTLKQLAEQDPAAFEQLRQEQINQALEQCPEHLRRRLQGLQFQIDSKRRLASNPMQTCVEISRMMHDSFENLRAVLNQHLSGQFALDEDNSESAQILSFKAPAAAR